MLQLNVAEMKKNNFIGKFSDCCFEILKVVAVRRRKPKVSVIISANSQTSTDLIFPHRTSGSNDIFTSLT